MLVSNRLSVRRSVNRFRCCGQIDYQFGDLSIVLGVGSNQLSVWRSVNRFRCWDQIDYQFGDLSIDLSVGVQSTIIILPISAKIKT